MKRNSKHPDMNLEVWRPKKEEKKSQPDGSILHTVVQHIKWKHYRSLNLNFRDSSERLKRLELKLCNH